MNAYARALYDMSVSLLPPGMEDLRVSVLDARNGVATFDKMNLRLAVVRGTLMIFPRVGPMDRMECPSENTDMVLTFRPKDGMWLKGCSPCFASISAQILSSPNVKHLTASTFEIHRRVGVPMDVPLKAKHILSFLIVGRPILS